MPHLKSKSCATNGPAGRGAATVSDLMGRWLCCLAQTLPGLQAGWQYAGPYQLSHILAGFPISLSLKSEQECFQDSCYMNSKTKKN